MKPFSEKGKFKCSILGVDGWWDGGVMAKTAVERDRYEDLDGNPGIVGELLCSLNQELWFAQRCNCHLSNDAQAQTCTQHNFVLLRARTHARKNPHDS